MKSMKTTTQSKYRAIRTVVDGITFASKKEAEKYQELKLLERAGKIRQLQLQPRFPLYVRGQLICTYVGDFSFYEGDSTTQIVVDVKGFKTPVYKLKKKLFQAIYKNVDFREE